MVSARARRILAEREKLPTAIVQIMSDPVKASVYYTGLETVTKSFRGVQIDAAQRLYEVRVDGAVERRLKRPEVWGVRLISRSDTNV